MKKIILLGILFSVCSCTTLKSTSEKNTNTKEASSSVKSKDSTKTVETNKAINDKALIPVQSSDTGNRDFDLAVNTAVDRILSGLNLSKNSGDNGYQMYYDLVNRQLEFQASIGQTSNEKSAVAEKEKTERSFEQTTDEYIMKKVALIPWWLYVIAFLYFAPRLIQGVSSIVNPVTSLITKIKSNNGGTT